MIIAPASQFQPMDRLHHWGGASSLHIPPPAAARAVSSMSPSSSASGGAAQHAQALLFWGNLSLHYKLVEIE